MNDLQQFQEQFMTMWPFLLPLMLWEGIWKAIAMWKAARNNHLVWYICILIFNTVGILPIVYLLLNRKKETE